MDESISIMDCSLIHLWKATLDVKSRGPNHTTIVTAVTAVTAVIVAVVETVIKADS